jgi:hypothetical protein
MAIAEYTDKFWYPSGVLASGVEVRVFPLTSNILAPLFADLAGTIPLANPVVTDAGGSVTFFVEAGEYWLHADSEAFRTNIGLPVVTPGELAALQAEVDAVEVDVGVLQGDVTAVEGDVVTLQSETTDLQYATLSTGIVSGGAISVNGGNPAAIDIAPLVGYITDFTPDPFNPTITRVVYPGGTVAMDAGSLGRMLTSWLMDANGVITQVSSPTSNEQRRQFIRIGLTSQTGGIITVDQSLPIIMQQPANQLSDLMAALRPFSISGNIISPNGVNLQINQSVGKLFAQSFNHIVGVTQTNDPHVSPTFAQTPVTFRYATRSSTVFGAPTTVVDVGNYDNGGVITAIGGLGQRSTIHRVWMFASNVAADQIVLQYGQAIYNNLDEAADRIGAGSAFVPNPLFDDAALVGYVAVRRDATDLSNVVQAVFVHPGKFATP